MFPKLGKKIRFSIFLTLALISAFVIAAFVTAADSAFISLQADRTTVQAGESVTFSVRTNALTNFVFATFDGARAQGVHQATLPNGQQDWTIVVRPTRTTDVSIFAGLANNEINAARMVMPINVSGVWPGIPPYTPPPIFVPVGTVPELPFFGVSAGLSINSVSETRATARNMVQLTIETGTQVNYVFIRCDAGRFHLGRRTHIGENAQTWVVDYRPRSMTPHRIQIYANTAYVFHNASRVEADVSIAMPFLDPLAPRIQNVTVFPRSAEVDSGSNVTLQVRTNADVDSVWLRDADDRLFVARSIFPATALQRNWEIVFTPLRTGVVHLFAGESTTATNAISRRMTISVRGDRATIRDAQATREDWDWHGSPSRTLRVTTNQHANTVWAVLSTGHAVTLNRTSGSSTSQTWAVHNWGGHLPITVYATERLHRVSSPEASRRVTHWTSRPDPDPPTWWVPAPRPLFPAGWVNEGGGWWSHPVGDRWVNWGLTNFGTGGRVVFVSAGVVFDNHTQQYISAPGVVVSSPTYFTRDDGARMRDHPRWGLEVVLEPGGPGPGPGPGPDPLHPDDDPYWGGGGYVPGLLPDDWEMCAVTGEDGPIVTVCQC